MTLYLTTPIYYVNARPHLGHAYSTLIADVVCRFWRLLGEKVHFQTGTDEHGDKVVAAARAAGLSPQDYADRVSGQFRAVWPQLHIKPDGFIRTTEPRHIRTVQAVLQQVYERGDIYFAGYSGLYCQGCERFLTEKELVDGNCPDHQIAPKAVSEENYFFRMSRYQDWLIEHIKATPGFITPERYRNEVLAFLQEPLEDLCISRPVSRLTWGIPLPFDNRFVTYVWFDALINYLTAIGYPEQGDFTGLWAAAEHIIAKDILKPHAIYWPTMLKAMGLPPYRRLHVHGYWNINSAKMSKSLGNVVRPEELVAQFGVDAVRYFLLREMCFGLDASFSTTALLERHNSDLANDLGNLFSRSLTMVSKFAGGRVPAPGLVEQADQELRQAAITMVAGVNEQMRAWAFHRALQEIWQMIGLANRYIVISQPWELAKYPAQAERLATVLYHLLEVLRLIALLLQPIMPETSRGMLAALGLGESRQELANHGRWGLLSPGGPVTLGPPLFPRLETEDRSQKTEDRKEKRGASLPSAKSAAPAKGEPAGSGLVSFETFKGLELRVAEVIAAEKIAKSDKLLKLTVKAPEERIIVAGIAQYYQPQELIGRLVIIVANLPPAKLMGVTSQGIVLAARSEDGQGLVLATVSAPVAPGSRLS